MRALLIALALTIGIVAGVIATWPLGMVGLLGFVVGMVFGETRHGR